MIVRERDYRFMEGVHGKLMNERMNAIIEYWSVLKKVQQIVSGSMKLLQH